MNTESLSLRPYQEEDVKFLIKHPCTGCFNEQRTGKTPTALMCIKARNLQNSKILIVTTTSALYQWQNEYERWLERPCVVCDGTPAHKKKIIDNWKNGLVISLGSLKETSSRSGYLAFLLAAQPDMVILDEAHHIRNPKTWAAKSAFKLCKIPIRMALTGTPAYGEAKDIFSILKFLFPQKFTSAYKFYQEYFKPEQLYIYVGGMRRVITEYKTFLPGKEKALQDFMKEYCTQRKRKDVMQWLPEKDKEIVKLPATKEQERYLKELKETYETEDVITQGILDRLVRYRQICLDPELLGLKSKSPKTEWILNYIKENPDTPLLIFSNFTQYLTKLFETLKKEKIKLAMIIGDVPPAKRRQYQTDFQDGKFNVFLINTMSGKEALTLDRAEAIIFADLYPPIGAIEQAEDRFVAISEERANKPHTIYNLAIRDSFDENILKLLEARKTETEVINNFKAQLTERSSL